MIIIAITGLTLWVFLVSLSTGSSLLAKTGFHFQDKLEEAAFSFALGFGLLGYLIFGLGLMRLLYGGALLGILAALTLGGVRQEAIWLRRACSAFKEIRSLSMKEAGCFYLALAGALVFALAFFQSLLPPTAHDALCYHLYIPKRFTEEHRMLYFPYLVNSLFPFLIQMYYALALLLKIPELSNVFHLLTGLGAYLGVVSIGRKIASGFIGLAAGLVFILTPGIFNQMVIAYNDVALTFFSFFAFYTFLIGREKKKDWRWYALMGVFSGLALSVKYLAAFHIAAITILMLLSWALRKQTTGETLRALAAYFGFTLIFSFLWYLRSYLYEGNPFYPFFSSIFGGTAKEYDLSKAGFGKGLLDLFLVGWRMTIFPRFFGGTWAQLGVAYLTFLPLIFLLDFKNDRLKIMGLFSAVMFLFWFYSAQNLRFLFSVLPVLSILAVLAARPVRHYLFLVLVLNAGLALFHGRDGYSYLVGLQDRSSYLLKTERTYSLSLWMNRNLHKDARVLNVQEVRMFYFEPEMIRGEEFRKKTRYDQLAKKRSDVLRMFEERGISHLLIANLKNAKPTVPSPWDIRTLVENHEFRASHLRLMHQETSFDGTNYEVYEFVYPK